MRTVVLRVVALALLLLLALSGVLTLRTVGRLPDTGLYLVHEAGDHFELVKVPRNLGVDDRTRWARRAVDELAAPVAPADAARGLSSAVPPDTRATAARFRRGRLTVELSPEFAEGGGSAAMTGRLYQLLWTLSEPADVESVSLWMDGAPLRWLGGEGIAVPNPWYRPEGARLPSW